MSEQGISAEVAQELVKGAQGAEEVHVNEPLEAELDSKAKPDVEVDKKPEDNRFASKFAALSRKEKAIKQKEAEIAAREAKLKEIEQQSQAPKQEAKEELPIEYRIKKDPFGTLKELGMDLDTLVNIALNDGKPTRELEMELLKRDIEGSTKKELEQIKAELRARKEEEEKAKQAAEEARNKQVIENFVNEITTFVDAKPDDYELIRAEEAYDLVYDVVAQHFEETKDPETGMGEVLDIQTAANEVENYLLEQAKKKIELKKIKGLVAPQAAKTEPSKNSPASVTLSNSQSQVQSVSSGKSLLTRDESLSEAAKLLKWRED